MPLSPEMRAVSELIALVQQRYSQGELSICAAHASGPKMLGPEDTLTIWFLVANDDLLRREAAGELHRQLQTAVHGELLERGLLDLAARLEVKLSSTALHDITGCVEKSLAGAKAPPAGDEACS